MSMTPSAPDFTRNVVCIFGLPFDAVTMAQAVHRVREAAGSRQALLLSTANLNFVVAARSDPFFRHSVIHSSLLLADGMPIVWISRLLALTVTERVPGSGLFEALSRLDPRHPTRIYFFGGPDGVAQRAAERINEQSAGLRCIGYESPGLGNVDSMSGDEQIERINAADPDFVVVALGARKGQAWIERNRLRMRTGIVSHLGAVINFAAGSVRRAPQAMQRLGLEWLWRIKEEPQLWRRYADDAAVLARLMLTSVLPLYLHGLAMRWTPRPPGLQAHLGRQGGVPYLTLSGSCDAANADVLREVLARVAALRSDVVVDLGGVGYIDAQAMGLLLLLYGFERDIGRSLRFTGLRRELRQQFIRHCTDFLIDNEKPAGAGLPAQAQAA